MGARQAKGAERLVVIGGSAGGVPALLEFVAALPADFPACLCIVIHIGTHPSILPELLNRNRPASAAHAHDGETLAPGKIYVAPPDRHMVVADGVLRLIHGPKENHTRPAIDPLFRTAAVQWRERVVGVILSGQLDDGAAGLKAVKDCGGIALVQQPDSALHPDMPRNALNAVAADSTGPPALLARELAQWVAQPAPVAATALDDVVLREAAIHLGKEVMDQLSPVADPSTLTCPNCGGTLWQLRSGGPERYRCHTGHAFTSLSLESAQAETAESALWAALRALREREMLLLRLARIAQATGDARQAAAGEAKAQRVHRQVLALVRMLEAGGAAEAPEASA